MNLQRYLVTNDTSTSFDIARGWQAAPDTSIHVPIYNVIQPTNLGSYRLYRGLMLTFFGTGAENSTFDYTVFVGHRGVGNGFVSLERFCSGTATLGTGTGGVAQPASASDVLCDTLTVVLSTSASTLRGLGGAIEAAYGSAGATAYSPSNNETGWLLIPDMGEWDLAYVDFDMTGATSGNCAYVRTR